MPFFVEAHGTDGSLLYDPDTGLRLRRAVAERWEGVETPVASLPTLPSAIRAGRPVADRWEDLEIPPDGTSPFVRWVDLASRAEPDPDNLQAALELNALAEAAILSAHKGHPVRPDLPRLDRV
jgi:hypothetical protein